MIFKITALVLGVLAIVLTFRAGYFIERLTGKEPAEGMVLRVKYCALGLAVIAFAIVFIIGR